MYFEFGSILLYLLLAVGFAAVALTAASLIRPRNAYPDKRETYECGEETIGTAYIQFNIRFYIIALVFLIFDVEVAVLFPIATIFREGGILAFAEVSVFVGILLAGFAYVWKMGDLEWVRSTVGIASRREAGRDAAGDL